MSHPPPRGPGGWPGRPTSHSPFRPASPFSPSPLAQPGRGRTSSTPVHHPMSPLSYPGMMHPMSPVPIGMPISPGMSPVFGCPPPGMIQCPRPRWPSPVSTGNAAPRPYIPQSPMESGQRSLPVPGAPPEYLIASYKPGDYEYIGVPLEPSQEDDAESGPSTAEIIASQSQDYVDEKLAEYQATIALLQDEQERVQKKTFVNWINSYLSKRVPPLRVDNLIEDLKDGTRLLALLEVLSGEKLPVERGRNLKRPHFLSNANTALLFLQSKKIKLVNINSSDLVDGRPPVVLGLIWTIILYFQIEENTRALEYLGQAWGSQSSLESLGTQSSAASERKRLSNEKWKQGARKTLLQWVTNALPKESGINVRDFGASWRDGNAFLAIIDAIRQNLVNLAALREASNRARLETAFEVAEVELGIARLLDPEDVDVPQPDEKSIMTYVAQFLHKYPEPRGTSFTTIQQDFAALLAWLSERANQLEQYERTHSFPSTFAEYLAVRTEADGKQVILQKLEKLVGTPSMAGISREAWRQVEILWRKLEHLLRKWLWLLDSSLPGEIGEAGRWLALAESLLHSDDDIPEEMNEETAGIISNKLEEHKKFFLDLPTMTEKFSRARATAQIPSAQLDNMSARFENLPTHAARRRVRLKFLEHKCCLIAFLFLVESKLKAWGGKYGSEERVSQMLEQYRNFVSRNRIFQEFQKAFLDMQQVVEEYKRSGDRVYDSLGIDRFMRETEEKWKNVSMDLRCVQSMLEEVMAYWRRWSSVSDEFTAWLMRAEPALAFGEEERMEFFQDISVWKDKYQQLSDTASFLIATTDDSVALGLRDAYADLTNRWDRLFLEARQYMLAGDLLRNRRGFRTGLETMQKWLRNAEAALATSQLTSTEKIKAYGERLQVLNSEIESIEELFKNVSKKFQTLIPDLSREEVDRMMNTLKKEKEALVKVRALIPMQLHLYHQLLVQQESLEAGQREISAWLDEAEQLLSHIDVSGGRDLALTQLERHKTFFSRTLYYKSMLESKNKVFSSIVKSVDAQANPETAEGGAELRALNERFNAVSQHAQMNEQRLSEAVRCWTKFRDCERQILEWLTAAENLMSDRRIENRQSVDNHKGFFGKVNERWIQDLVNAGQDLRNLLPTEHQAPVVEAVEALQRRWKDVLTFAPLHLMRLEFRLDEVAFMQYLQEIEVEVNSEQQALIRNEDVESILQRNRDFFVSQGVVVNVERCLQTLKKINVAYMQLKPEDTSLAGAVAQAEQLWEESAERVEALRTQLRRVPEQWAAYRKKFDEMVRWMDQVDDTLRTILKEVNSLEEFENEKSLFQKVCHEADSKREEMKWLVQTLDSLTNNRSDREAVAEQHQLEQLITRYKNLIPTIEITMTKTDIYSKSYTYRKEVREVCILLRKVREQDVAEVSAKAPERLREAVTRQEERLNQLEQQRGNIVSMLQRGKDLLKDQHTPTFVSSEIQQLESTWNDTYGQSIERLKSLKNYQKLSQSYQKQKEEILNLINSANEELEHVKVGGFYDASQVSSDLRAKMELKEMLKKSSEELMGKIRETLDKLEPGIPSAERVTIREDITKIEKTMETTIEKVEKRVFYLKEHSLRWSKFQSEMTELRNWSQQSAPQAVANIQDMLTSPEERVRKTELLQKQISEKMTVMKTLERQSKELIKDDKTSEAKRLRGEIEDLQKLVDSLDKSIEEQRVQATRNLATWKEYEVGIQKVKPWIESAESQATSINSKPSTLDQAREMLVSARAFEKKCEEHLPKVQELSYISQQISGRTVAPDEVDAVYTRWNAVHDTSIQTSTKLDKLVSSWTTFERDADEFNRWLVHSEEICKTKPNYQTPEPLKLEQNLNSLKELNKIVSDRQAQLISLTQVCDHISHGLSLEGATNLKSRVAEMKTRVGKLADTVRHHINLVSDALLARQEFAIKISEFENWMTRLRTSIAEISEVGVANVDTNLQAVHGFLQEHLEKQPNFSAIYEEVKRLSSLGTPEETKALNEVYIRLAEDYQALEDDLQHRRRGLEKWAELLNWYNDTTAQLSHAKYELDARKPNIADLEKLSSELQSVYAKIESWKDTVPVIDSAVGVHMRDKLDKPLTASGLVQELESRAVTLKTELATKRDKLENLGARWDNFRKIQGKLTLEITSTQSALAQITATVDTCEALAPAVEKIDDLIEEHARAEPDKELLHREGTDLMREDAKATTNVQVVVSSVDENWEKVNELLKEARKKYSDMDCDWRQYREAREKLLKFIEDSNNLQQASREVPSDVTQANVALEKHKRAAEVLKKGRQFLERMDEKAQQLIKEASLMSHFKVEAVEGELSRVRNQYQDTYTTIVERTQSYETQVIIWKQIEEAKYELTRWLSDTNEALLSACERLVDAENGAVRLGRYREELPSSLLLRQGITTKTEQLTKINNASIPTLVSLNKLLDDEFRVVAESAKRLEALTSSLNEEEKAIRLSLKNASEQISRMREDIIKCDDLTGDNAKILERINKCQELQRKLVTCSTDLDSIGRSIASAAEVYPVIERSSLPKELQSLQQRREGVSNHADKVIATLIAFLTKLYHEKFSALQRMVATHKEKVLWCQPEQSSDRYNLEVKMTSLMDVEAGIRDCEARKADTDCSLALLANVESVETTSALKSERDCVADDLAGLKKMHASIRKVLARNIALWTRYEVTSENVILWLKETESKIRGESSALVALEDVEEKIVEIEAYQKSVDSYESEMKSIADLGEDILQVSPESRVAQYVSHLNARYHAIQKFLTQHLEKLKELKSGRDLFRTNVKEMEQWLADAEKKLKVLDEISGPRAITFYQSRLKELKVFVENRERGQIILNKTSEAGEALFPRTTPDAREVIRAELRALRNRVDHLADWSSTIYKKIESDMMHRSSFEDKYAQVKQWLVDAQGKLGDKQDLLPTLQEKKLALHSYRAIAADVGAHRSILQQLQERLSGVKDDEATDMLSTVIEGYERLSQNVEDRINIAEKHVSNHEAYLQTLDKTRDWINAVINEAAPLLEDLTVERDSAQSKILQVDQILLQKTEGDRVLADCNTQLNIILEQTSINGHPALLRSFEQQKKIWEDFLAQCETTRSKLRRLCDEWREFEEVVEALELWTKQMEARIKDATLKSTEEAKRAHLQKLRALEEEITAKGADLNAAVEKGQGAHVAESELATRVSRQATRYQAMRNQAKEAIARYEQFIKEHSAFNVRYSQFRDWIKGVSEELAKHREIVGDLAVLQSRQKSIRDLADTRTKENPRFESVVDLGEKLYVHTSPEGREMVRQQLRNLRALWDGFTEELQMAMQRIDQCLMQFAEFSLSQEQLTAWLRDVERDMHQHTELKSTLEEKRAQLQNHKIMHSEIMSHQTLVESVCDKAQRLVDQTKDTSLNVYLQSIKQLFQNIVIKSQDLLENLEDCADKHNKFNLQCKSLDDWLSVEKEKLTECNDITGERTDISRRLATLSVLKNGQASGAEHLAQLRGIVELVVKSTAPKGQGAVQKEADTLASALQQHLNEIDVVEAKQKAALQRWQDFEDQLDAHTKWFRSMEAAFRDQQLQATLGDKEERLEFFKSKREVILMQEKTIDEFVDKSHGLLNASGVERIKPTISQVGNRYQALHVLSKEVLSRCLRIVDDHRAFAEKLKSVDAWLTPLEQSLAQLKVEEVGGNVETRTSRLKMLLAERDQAESRLSALNAAGDRILPTTSAQGRESVRYEMRHARERWDSLAESIVEQQKKQDAQSLQWASYQETLAQISAWLDNMERGARKQDSTSTWSTLPEVRSKLLKAKNTHQEILAHKRIVEAISEKANALIQVTQPPTDVKSAVADVSRRYEQLVSASQRGIGVFEGLADILAQFHDLQKTYQDYQKQQWEKLSNYTDYTGNKTALQARLLKVVEIQDGQTESELKLNVLEEHVKQNAASLPLRSQEAMERDVANLRFESKKFATAVGDVVRRIEERIQQWCEYENALERLLAWLAEAEAVLKNYSLKNSIDEKQEQLEKYQDVLKIAELKGSDVSELVSLGDQLEQTLIMNLRSHETEFDKMSDDSSELMEISGETRFSVNVQQVTSRFQSVQATAKELVKKCEQAAQDHLAYLERYKQCTEWLTASQSQYQATKDNATATKQELTAHGESLRELLSRMAVGSLLVNNTVEAGERLYPTTGTEGREIIRQQLLDLQQALESLHEGVTSTEREIQVKISRWLGFDESSDTFERWLSNLEKTIKPKIELRTTLDEKRVQLQLYRDSLHDISVHQEALLALRDRAESLPNRTEPIDRALGEMSKRYSAMLKRVQAFVEKYEAIVSDHQQYSKAVLETHEWLDATHNAVNLWGDSELERVSLHTNLDRLKNLLHSLPEEQPRVQQIRALGEKVIPGTLESGQVNIRSQVDSSQQEWEGLVSAAKSTIDVLENKLQQWQEFESLRERCLDWIRDTDTQLHAVDLKANLSEKKAQLECLRALQGEVRAKELEIDAVTERAQQLQKNVSSRTTNISELDVKYQQISAKVKDLNNRWHTYVTNHQDFDNHLSACLAWLDGIREKLDYCSDFSVSSQRELERKMETVQELLLYKEAGFSKIQGVVELAQTVLANTAPAGHGSINEAVARLQEQWSGLTSKMLETKTNLDDSINKWAGLLEQIQSINKTMEFLHTSLTELVPFQTTMSEKRSQLERIKALEERIRCENIEVDNLKCKVSEMIASGQQGSAASKAQGILSTFDEIFKKVQSLLAEREAQFKDHRRYKEAHDDLIAWLSRAREKIPSIKQKISDKLSIENAVAPLESLVNKKAQGELLVEHLQHTGKVVCASTSTAGAEGIRNEIRALSESFETMFREIQQQKDQLEDTVSQWRDYKDEYERLSDWLQQFDILIKAQKNALLPNVVEKEKQVQEVQSILENLTKGAEQIDKFNKTAAVLLSSHLDTYINNQLRHLNSRHQVQVNLAKDVLNKVETNLAQHREYDANLGRTRDWIDAAKQTIRQGTEAAASSSREELQARLDKIQDLLKKREEGQNLMHLTVNCGEKVARNTRSDGREEINTQLKEIQSDWERLVKKISTTKVHLETSLLQWADYSSSYSQLQQWINDREAKLQQVCEQKVSKAKKGLAGLNSLAIGERKANLRQTNSIVQDIVAFEPMIQSVATKAEDLQQATPATEISIKYETLSKQAQELYARQKETVEQHQAFIDSGTEFVQWIRAAKEKLGKCSEPTGDKDSLSSKISQLKVLHSELPEGQAKLEKALEKGNAACHIADAEDKEIIEEEVAMLQEEYDNYVDSLGSTKSLLEIGIVKWTEYEDQYSEASEWLNQTEQLVQSFNKLQDSLEEKKNVLERFQTHLQTLFDWQKELDRLNMKAQMLLETCADTRISNQVTQLTTKYNALLSLAKEIMRRLELHYQEHQQHNTLYQECQDWIDRTRDKLAECRDTRCATLSEVNNKLNTCKAIRQSLEQGQNKLRYALELKEKVIMNTEQNGAAKIKEDTENLKAEFDKLMSDVEEARQKLSVRATALEELGKLYRLITDWMEEVEAKVGPESFKNDLSEKRALLEKYRTVARDIQGHCETVDRLKARLSEDTTIPRESYDASIARYDELRKSVAEKIAKLEDQVREHERLQQAQNEAVDWVRKTRVDIQQYSMTHGEKNKVIEREKKINEILLSLPQGETLIGRVVSLSDGVAASTGGDGQEVIGQEVQQLQLDWKALQNQCAESQKTLGNCITMWSQFTAAMDSMKNWLDEFAKKIASEQERENKMPQDLARCKQLVEEALRQKPVLEELNDKCEALLEVSACSWARDRTVQLQSLYTILLTDAQGLVSRVEKNLSDHTEFLKARKELEEWLSTAHGSVQDCVGVGDVAWARDKLETTRLVATRITEGQHLLSTLKNAFAKAINTALPEQQEQLRSDMAALTSRWEQLNMDLNTVQAAVKSILTRWEDHVDVYERLKNWLNDTEHKIQSLPETKGEIGEMKTRLERYRHIQEEVRAKKTDLDALLEESVKLSAWAKNDTTRDQARILLSRWECIGKIVDQAKLLLENEMEEYNAYYNALQETEKWLLQVSFQLMSHNSRYITSKDQTLEQIRQQDLLLDEIRKYQQNLDDLRSKGQQQIDCYISVNTNIEPTIQTQLQNVQESYNSLLNTALQIKNRLDESLAKFEEYERTLESIMQNLNAYEPEITRELEAPLDTLELAEENLESSRQLHNKLQAEKTRLAVAVEACEAAAACVSRPGSPLDAPAVQIPQREVEVRARLEDLIDQKDKQDTDGLGLKALLANIEKNGFLMKLNQMCDKMQTHLASVAKAVAELEEQSRQKNALRTWTNQQRALCAEWRSRPAKLRAEAAQAELQAMNELLGSIGDRRTRALAELSLHADGRDRDVEEGLEKLESELIEAIADKQSAQDLIQKYRTQVQDIQSWLDGLSKRVDVIEKGNGLNINQKISAVGEIAGEFESQGPGRLEEVKKLGDAVMDAVSNLDSQQIEEQIKSVERRYSDMAKKLQRKSQVLDMTAQGIEATRREIEDNREWISNKKSQARVSEPLGFETKPADDRVQALKAMLKEAENKQVIIDTLEKRVGNMQNELEIGEQQQLEADVRALRGEQAQLTSSLREIISAAVAAADARKKLESDLERAKLWIKAKHNDLKKLCGYLPLRATRVEAEIAQHNGIDADIAAFSEGSLNDVLKQAGALMRDCNDTDRARLDALLDSLAADYDSLKQEAAEKQASLADLLQGRRAFENEVDRCARWIKEAETATSSDVRSTSIDVLREQLAKYDRLRAEARAFGEDVEKVLQQGKSILPTVSDADKLELSDALKNMRDAHSRVSGVIDERAAALERSIAEAEEAAARVAAAVAFVAEVQEELRGLRGRPIGPRVEDVEGMLAAYEKILDDLKQNKAKLSDLQIGDLHGVTAQLDDLVRALEAQIARLRQLLLLRQQFLALVTEIMTFITKYTEIVCDIEQQDQPIEEKIKRYDDAILKIQECEAILASATDKGAQITEDGSASDRNNVTEQLQSLKQQLQSLRRAVEMQREKHELAVAEHRRLAQDLAEILDWLESKEKEVRSRPLLERAVKSVEEEIDKHKQLQESVNEYLDRIKILRDSVRHEEGMPGSLREMLSEAVSLLTSMPREMEERENYLESNRQMRLSYVALAEKLRSWVCEAEIRLAGDREGLDFENIVNDLEEHKIYFSSEPSMRELVSQQIQAAADRIWPSLSSAEQEEQSLEQQQHNQLLKNTLNTAKSRRAQLEHGAESWREYSQTLERVKAVISRSRFSDEPVTTLAGLQFNIQKLTHALNDVQNQQFELDLVNERGRALLTQADVTNRKRIENQLAETGSEWKDLVSGLEGRRDTLEALSRHWEDLEAQWNHVETRLTAIEERNKLVDCVVRSKHHIRDTIKSLNELLAEAEKLGPVVAEVKVLSEPVLTYLAAFSEAPARALEERLDMNLAQAAESLISSLRLKSDKASADLKTLEADELESKRLQNLLDELHQRIDVFYIFGADQDLVEVSLVNLSKELERLVDGVKTFCGDTKARYQTSQQLVPSDLAQVLASLELNAEGAVQAMEEKQREQKRARTVRTDYLADVEELQAWVARAELQVQDRSVEPLKLREHLRQIQTELGPIADKLERLTKNGRTIVDNTNDQGEKELIEKTILNLTEQIGQVRAWLEEKKQQVGDSLDAWQRFLVLYESVTAWTLEKRNFLKEPLKLSTLVQTRQRLHDYSTAVKSCKQVNKNLSEMGKELELIGQITSVGDLPEKLASAEEAKVEVEGHLLETNALLQEASEEWEQCEKKFKDVKSFLEKARQSLDSAQNKKKPLRDQHALREKMTSDIAIQKTKISISVEKLQVHFRSGISGDNKISETAAEMTAELTSLNDVVKEQTAQLEACLSQIDQYQQEIQQLRQQIVQVEQQLRAAMSPTYLPNDREKAVQEQQFHRERIKSLQSKIQARTERSKLLVQRATPDLEPLDP